jgi:hypothetical protein
MLTPKLTVKTSGITNAELGAQIKAITRLQVYVGIPESRSARGEAGVTNAQLAFLHTHGVRSSNMRRIMYASMNRGLSYSAAHALYLQRFGSPAMNIPPRPIIEPAIEDSQNKAKITVELRQAAQAALDPTRKDGRNRALFFLRRAGMVAQNLVRAWFVNPRNGWAPNAPSTIRRKGSNRPLIDTGELRKSITYVVESR